MPVHLYTKAKALFIVVPMPTQEVNFAYHRHKSAFSRGTLSLNGLK